jgi:hypothetical protein
MTTEPDQYFIARCLDGHRDGFRHLVLRYEKPLLAGIRVQTYPPHYPQQFEFMYLAGVKASAGADVPIRCVRKDLPSAEYALFPVENGPQGIDAPCRYAYKEWLPSSGYDPA